MKYLKKVVLFSPKIFSILFLNGNSVKNQYFCKNFGKETMSKRDSYWGCGFWMAQYEDEFPARVQISGHLRTLIWSTVTSELMFGGVQKLLLKLETRPRTEQFKSHMRLLGSVKELRNRFYYKTHSFSLVRLPKWLLSLECNLYFQLKVHLHWASASTLWQCCDDASDTALIGNNGVVANWLAQCKQPLRCQFFRSTRM